MSERRPPSRRPIGRPPGFLTGKVVGWAARREYRRREGNLRPRRKALRPSPQVSAARTRHNGQAPEVVTIGAGTLAKSTEFGLMWQCPVCTAWIRDFVVHGYTRKCAVCRLARPPRVVVLDVRDDKYYRRHTANVHSFAAIVRALKFAAVAISPPVRWKRQNCLSTADLFLELARMREEANTPPVSAERGNSEWFTQVFAYDERYTGTTASDICMFGLWRDSPDHQPAAATTFAEQFTSTTAPDAFPNVRGNSRGQDDRPNPTKDMYFRALDASRAATAGAAGQF